jgi:hypothetical protein
MEHGSFFNSMMVNSKQRTPEVGEGATEILWSDRHAGTIIEVSPNGKTLKWQRDTARRADKNGMSDAQDWEYTPNPDAPVSTFTLRQNGRWVMQGQPMKGSVSLLIGIRDEYYDFSF